MAGSTNKKVVAIRFDREPVAGFVNPQTFLQPGGIELLTAAGTAALLSYAEVKALCFVRDFEQDQNWKMNRLFAARPKTAGLWIRLHFQDGDALDGVIPNNLLLVEPYGFNLAPADASFQNQRMFVPTAALKDLQVMGVIGSPLRQRKPKPVQEQLDMFENP